MRSPLIAAVKSDLGPVNSTTETDIFNAPLPTWFKGGELLNFDAYGDQLNNTAGTVTYLIKAYLGATTLFASNAFAIAQSANRRKWMLTGKLWVAQRDEQGFGLTLHTTAGSSFAMPLASSVASFGVGYGTATENLGLTKRLRITMTLGTADATADFICHAASLTAASPHLSLTA